MNLGTQYYRAPFPEDKHWEDDMKKMADCGLNTVQLWVLWAWVEAKPGTFEFGDYDRLVETAGRNGLNVVLSTIAEIQPYWIHREVPGSELVTSMGHKVVSSNRGETHFGLTPGGCTDNPGVWERMSAFLTEVATHYAPAPNICGWDAWNELRWDVQADGLACYCEHTVKAFREWLDSKYGGLDGLNSAWKRRYGQWDEVLPGKKPNRPYTEMMAFQHFLTWRACEHARKRYDIIKAIDPDRPVTVHGGQPSPGYGGNAEMTALNRGNDWFFADRLDGVGCSSFPKWFNIDDAAFGSRIEFVRSAARGKAVWLSELQGGRSAIGFGIHPSVDAASQQRWIWNGIACGADTVLFWCWRDEVFGRESAGFGLIGLDGLAEERMAAMRITGDAIRKHKELLDGYRPCPAEVGVMFSPQSYYINWAEEQNAGRAKTALDAYCRALVRKSIPYDVVEEEHLESLHGLKVLFMPRALVLSETAEDKLEAFVRNGGTLVCESECGAFSPQGFYRYPDERFLSRLTGATEVGRRMPDPDTIAASIDGKTLRLDTAQWLTPLTHTSGNALAECPDGALLLEVPVDKGRVLFAASFPGEAYGRQANPGFEDFLEWTVRSAGWTPEVEIVEPAANENAFLYVKHGSSNGRNLLFVFFQQDQERAVLRFRTGMFEKTGMIDLLSGEEHKLTAGDSGATELTLAKPERQFAVLAEEE